MEKILLLILISLNLIMNLHGQLIPLDPYALDGLQVGEPVPEFFALDQEGKSVSVKELLSEGPVVLVFYRGQWCPICNQHLQNFQDSLLLLDEFGVQLVAISPERPEYLMKMVEKNNLTFRLLYDEGYKISQLFNLLFEPEKKIKNIYEERLHADFSNAHRTDRIYLPIPATYIIGKEGIVSWRHFDPDYRKRSTVAEMIAFFERSEN